MHPEDFLAERVVNLSTSGIRRIFDLAATMTNPIDFSMGQPDFPVPEAAKQAAIDAIRNDCNGYTVTHGRAELRADLKALLVREFGNDADAIDVLVTAGVSGGLNLATLACLNPGDEVIIPDPYFVSYAHLVTLAGGVPVPVTTAPDFVLTADRIAAAITPRTRFIMLNSPSNPTGVVAPEQAVRDVCTLARDRNLVILSDEIYNLLSFDCVPASPFTFAPERTILLRGFGKSYGMTGWRMGFAAGPPAIIAQMAKVQQYTYVCAAHPFQHACRAALDCDMSAVIEDYRAKRDLAVSLLDGKFTFPRPGGGFFVYCRVPAGYDSGTAFVEAAIERNVLTVPGAAFSQTDDHFRISYAVPNARLTEGCNILANLAG